MSKADKPAWGWMDGKFVPWDDCVLHVRTQAVMFGALVFEGIRAYWNSEHEELYVFRLQDHLRRLSNSMKLIRMQPQDMRVLEGACVQLLARNGFRGDSHLNPYAYSGSGPGWWDMINPLHEGFVVTGALRPQSKVIEDGVNVCVSSWVRISDVSLPPRIKAMPNYGNSRLAVLEARANGYDNAILLNNRGTVAEGAGACLMIVRDGQVATPPTTAGILEGLTRSTLIDLFREKLNLQVVEREIDRTELYLSEEVFYCGSGFEVMPIVSIDKIQIGDGKRGPLATAIQAAYFAVARGEVPSHPEWRTAVYQAAKLAV